MLTNEKLGETIIRIGEPYFHEEKKYDSIGYGYIYYGLVRIYRPKIIVCIGSARGFAPIVFAHGCKDNKDGKVYFVDPSYFDKFWCYPDIVKIHFNKVYLNETWIETYCMTNKEFYNKFNDKLQIDLLFIDGADDKENVYFDFYKIGNLVKKDGFILIHDIYHNQLHKKRYFAQRKLVKEIKKKEEQYDIVRFPGIAGLGMIRKLF